MGITADHHLVACQPAHHGRLWSSGPPSTGWLGESSPCGEGSLAETECSLEYLPVCDTETHSVQPLQWPISSPMHAIWASRNPGLHYLGSLTEIGDSLSRPRKASLSAESSAIWLLPASVDLRTPPVVLPPSHPVLSHPEPTPCSTADGSFCQPL